MENGMDIPQKTENRSIVCMIQQSCCCCWVISVVSNSVWPHRRQPPRLPRPWDSPGKNTGLGCHCLLQCMKVKSESDVTAILLLGEFMIHKDTCMPVFIAAQMSTDRWIDKEDAILNIHTHSRSHSHIHIHGASLVAQTVKNLPAMQETGVLSLGQKDPLEKRMATVSSSIAWRIPWTEEP